jgi:hypothetical protein
MDEKLPCETSLLPSSKTLFSGHEHKHDDTAARTRGGVTITVSVTVGKKASYFQKKNPDMTELTLNR